VTELTNITQLQIVHFLLSCYNNMLVNISVNDALFQLPTGNQ